MVFVLPCACLKKEDEDEDPTHLHKPRDNKLYQQKLKPCCMLVVTTQKVVTLFVLTGLIFLPIGITLLVQSTEIYQLDVDYTDCYEKEFSSNMSPDDLKPGGHSGIPCSKRIESNPEKTCFCDTVQIDIPERVNGEIMFLYGLENYYQNHRLYRQSQSFLQLMGDEQGTCALKEYCDPFDTGNNEQGAEVTYYPKGAIANSYFTDTFKLLKITSSGTAQEVDLNTSNISWKSDRDSKFILPANWNPEQNWKPLSENFIMPKDWVNWRKVEQSYTDVMDKKILPVDVTDEHFINWMNPAAFPSFTKLYAKVNLTPGKYYLRTAYRYQVHGFGGKKFVRLAETSWMGGRSLFLGSAYCIVGFMCLVAASFFGVISRKTRAKRHERKKKIDEQLVHYKDTLQSSV